MAACLFTLRGLNLDYDFEKFFPQDDEQLDFYLEFREKFGTDNDFLLVSATSQSNIFDPNFSNAIRQTEKKLQEIKYVESTLSPYSIKIPVIGPLGFFNAPLISEKLNIDSSKIVNDPLLDQRFISKDRKSIAFVVRHQPFLSKVKSDSLLQNIKSVLNAEMPGDYRMAGKIYGQNYYINKMGSELSFFALTSLILLAIFLFISFRNAWGVWLPLVIVVLTVVADLAVITILGYSISVLTTILPTILFVVGISDVVHLSEKYIQELREGRKKTQALINAYKQIGLATLLTSVTTAIGFLTLLTSSISPIANFGWFAAVGVCLAFILSFTIFPAFLLLLPEPKKLVAETKSDFWTNKLKWLFRFSLKNTGIIIVSFALLSIGSIYGIYQVQINNYLLEDLAENDPHRQDFFFFEQQFGGVRPFELAGKIEGSSLLDHKNVLAIDSIENFLSNEYGVNNLFSPLMAIKMANRAKHGGNVEYYRIPKNADDYEKLLPVVKRSLKNPSVKQLYQQEDESFRISGNVVDLVGAIFKGKNEDLISFLDGFKNHGMEIQQTGMGMLIDKNNQSLSVDMLLGLVIAFLAVGILMGFLYKSFKMVIIALIPNLIPLLFIGGIMYLLQIDLKLSTAIIFTIAFGIAVDDTIHFLARFRLEIAQGKSLLSALYNTYLGAGKAILVTSIILFSGFITLVFSTFSSTYYLGLLVSITLLIAVITDLLLLPGLLYLAYKKRSKALKS